MKERLENVASVSGLRIVDGHLILESSYADLGISIQKFLEMSKMIGDVYFVHKHREKPDDQIILNVQSILQSEGFVYHLQEKVPGQIEMHPFDIVAP